MKTYNQQQRQYLILVFIVLLGCSLLYLSRIIFDGLMGAIIFFTIFRPLFVYLTERRKWPAGIAALSIIGLSFLLLIVPFITLTYMVYDKILYYEAHPNELSIFKENLWPLIQKYFTQKENIDELINSIQTKVFALFTGALNSISHILLQIAVLYFLLYYMLKEHVILEKMLLKYLPFKVHNLNRLGTKLTNITYSNLIGQGFICFIQGTLVAIGFIIFGIQDAVFWGVVCFFLSFIPFVGSPLVFVPAGLFQLYTGDIVAGIGILIWGFALVTNIDNVIRFYLAKKIGDTHPLITIIGVIIGVPAFGILGLVYGPLLIAYFFIFVKIWEDTNKR